MESMLGKRFGKLTVIEDVSAINVKVQCDCGQERTVSRYNLRNSLKSCGCEERPRGSRRKSLLGNTYGTLNVIEDDLGRYVKVKCSDCGSVRSVVRYTLHSYRTKSCICRATKTESIIGNRYGKLVVIEDDLDSRVKVKCDCGEVLSVTRSSLSYGKRKSCGCYNEENKKRNKSDLEGQQFGMIKVLHKSDKTVRNACLYECHCLCCDNVFTATRAEVMKKRSYCCECQRDPIRPWW